MARLGFDYRPRPNDAAGTGGTWDDWNQWHGQLVAADPGFESAFQGSPDEQAGGCQLEAYLAVRLDARLWMESLLACAFA